MLAADISAGDICGSALPSLEEPSIKSASSYSLFKPPKISLITCPGCKSFPSPGKP